MDLSQANGCPTTALFTVAETADHPHLREREFVKQLPHPALGSVRVMGAPVLLPDSPGGPRAPAPLLGQHNDDVLGALAGAPAGSRSPRSAAATGALPLAGIRVANFGWGWLGPVAGQTLAFLGAEVYKIESRARVDINRTIPPFGGGVRDPDRSLQNHAAWAGNGSVTLNLKKPEGQELARELVSRCDIVVENFGPGVMNKLELGYEQLRAVKPDIIMTSMPAAGLFGPLAGIRTYGMSLSSITGLDSLTGYRDGPPIPMENAFADPLGGIIGALASLFALHHRDRTGRGQYVDYSQQEGVMQMIAPAFMDYTMNGRVAGPMGNRHPLAAAAPHGVFPCTGDDRWIAIAVFDDAEWQGLVEVMGDPAWARASEYAGAAARIANIDALEAQLAESTRGCDSFDLAERLQAAGVAATPVLNVGDLLTHPHYRARETFVEVEHPLGFRETIYDVYAKTSGAQFDLKPGPVMGCDNERVFKQLLEIPEERYRQLVEDEVIA
jgi:benzylsuccinate CoA-transferase BbsF subunit